MVVVVVAVVVVVVVMVVMVVVMVVERTCAPKYVRSDSTPSRVRPCSRNLSKPRRPGPPSSSSEEASACAFAAAVAAAAAAAVPSERGATLDTTAWMTELS